MEPLSYETLDKIADSINPILLLASFAVLFLPRVSSRKRVLYVIAVIIGLLFVYGIQLLDERLGIWPKFTSDYSTHTAFAAALVTAWMLLNRKLGIVGCLIFLGYVALMLFQRYHSILDIASTAIIIVLCIVATLIPVQRIALRLHRTHDGQ